MLTFVSAQFWQLDSPFSNKSITWPKQKGKENLHSGQLEPSHSQQPKCYLIF